jgi:hypothetical protein
MTAPEEHGAEIRSPIDPIETTLGAALPVDTTKPGCCSDRCRDPCRPMTPHEIRGFWLWRVSKGPLGIAAALWSPAIITLANLASVQPDGDPISSCR